MGVVECGVELPKVGKVERSRQDIAVLPEMVVRIEGIAVIGVCCLVVPFVERIVLVASGIPVGFGETVPGLVGSLEIAEIAVADDEALVQPGESGVIGPRAGTCLVDVTVGVGLGVTAVEDEMMPEETR